MYALTGIMQIGYALVFGRISESKTQTSHIFTESCYRIGGTIPMLNTEARERQIRKPIDSVSHKIDSQNEGKSTQQPRCRQVRYLVSA